MRLTCLFVLTKIYKITDAGKEAVHKALDLIQTNHPLGNLDAFRGLS
jgi:DNA-binding PadR family transcriptional regulator